MEKHFFKKSLKKDWRGTFFCDYKIFIILEFFILITVNYGMCLNLLFLL